MQTTTNTNANPKRELEAIEQLRKGDCGGMATLYELHRSRVYSICLHYTRNAFDAEDLTQDIFLDMFRKVSTFRGDAKFGTWLYKVALNAARLKARRQRRHQKFILPAVAEETLSSAESAGNPSHRIVLLEALSRLTPIRRTALILFDIQGFTHDEVASKTGTTVIASKSRLHRAHAAIRSSLAKRDPVVDRLWNVNLPQRHFTAA